ncbi:hypothetical protein KIN20_027166 [Parelaphostrongylus tenuis]|uniref:Uncharacterized protein n=1 Tax=Parelaphostrongylus tenuis TaxID=148309 RepID=A0AAD5QYZ7_PARTN|nr:hypothetical protein KIN20_027166 [Parelaphostrongylus tenuis]
MTRNFTVSGFTFPVTMTYSSTLSVSTRIPGIPTTSDAAKSFVSRLVMQTITDVLEQQGRSVCRSP